MIEIRRLNGAEARQHLAELADVLVDCVAGGASVNFMAGFSQSEAEAFFGKVVDGVESGERIVLAAFLDSRLVGTVQIVPAPQPNQPYRADIAKLLVHRCARGRGIAALLMHRVEEISVAMGRTLLMLDTTKGGTAERLYTRLGWTELGVVPDHCTMPDGSASDTTFFYKHLRIT